MRKLTFGMNLSLDGYIAAPGDDLGWSVPSDELFQWWSDRVGALLPRWACVLVRRSITNGPSPAAVHGLHPVARPGPEAARTTPDDRGTFCPYHRRHGRQMLQELGA
jgi:hypothetical protein